MYTFIFLSIKPILLYLH